MKQMPTLFEQFVTDRGLQKVNHYQNIQLKAFKGFELFNCMPLQLTVYLLQRIFFKFTEMMD